MRVGSIAELRKMVSPDVIIEEDSPPTPLNKELRKADKAATFSLEDKFYARWKELGGRDLETQFVFHPERKWRFDFSAKQVTWGNGWGVAFEVQGGIYAEQSGHRSFEGVQRDYEKLNAAQMLGWKVFQVTSKMIDDTEYMQSLVDFVNKL